MFAYHGVDYLEIDSLLNDDEKLVRQMVREFVEKEIIPHIEEWNREGKFPLQLVPLMAELGFYGANMEGYGCAGMSNVQYGLIMQELEFPLQARQPFGVILQDHVGSFDGFG